MIIDSHHHFWRYDPIEYDWIGDDLQVIRRDFLPERLSETLAAAGVDRAVSVQARQTLDETLWLCEHARQHPELIAGVVGWVDLTDPDIDQQLKALRAPELVGMRHILQAEPDERFMLGESFQRGIAALKAHDLVYDVLIYERHLPAAIELVDAHPAQPFVIDHIAKPRIRDEVLEPWRTHLREIARRQHVSCKLSGVVTQANFQSWTPEQIRPYLETALDAFGPERLMFGSDWPVCLVATDYQRWLEIVRELIHELSAAEQASILGGTAQRVYGL